MPLSPSPISYVDLLDTLKTEIRSSQLRAVTAANKELLLLYWRIGTIILEQEKQQGWGQKVVVRLAADLKAEFPGMKGVSPRNLRYMKSFAAAYPAELLERDPMLQAALATLTWYHHLTLLDKIKDVAERTFYIHAARSSTNL